MTLDTSQLRQWLEERRDRAAEKMRKSPTNGDIADAILSTKVAAEYFFALDALDKVRELESK